MDDWNPLNLKFKIWTVPKFSTLNCYNSAKDCSTVLKFDALVHYGFPETIELSNPIVKYKMAQIRHI